MSTNVKPTLIQRLVSADRAFKNANIVDSYYLKLERDGHTSTARGITPKTLWLLASFRLRPGRLAGRILSDYSEQDYNQITMLCAK